MADGLGLNAESVKRVVKSKWFLPALGIGGVIVVLLIVSQRGSGAASSGDGTLDYPGEVYDPNTEAPITGAPDIAGLESMINELFSEYTGAINSQIQQQYQAQTDYLKAQVEAQQSYLESFAGNVEDAISNIQSPAYYDPYAGYTPDASAGYDYSGYGSDFIQTEPAYTESTISTYEPEISASGIIGFQPGARAEIEGAGVAVLNSVKDSSTGARRGRDQSVPVLTTKPAQPSPGLTGKPTAIAVDQTPVIINQPPKAPPPTVKPPETPQARSAPKPAPTPAPVQRTGQAAPTPAPAPKPAPTPAPPPPAPKPVPKQQRGGRTITQ